MKRILTTMILVASLLSCSKNDNLDPVPQTFLSDVNAFETPERVYQQVLGMYSGVKGGQFYGGRYLVYNDIKGEEFNNVTTNNVTNFSTWNFNTSPTLNEVQNLWYQAYLSINRINTVIKGLSTSPISDNLKVQYEAESKFLRSLCYFSLVTTYCKPYTDGNGNNLGLPLRLNSITSSGESNLARSTVAEVYAQIISDLNFAEANLPSTYSSAYDNTTRAHKNTAISLKTRVYLNMGKYSDVITEANKIVSLSAPFSAPAGVNNKLNTSYSTAFTNYTTNESIFSFAFSPQNLPGTQNGLGSYYNPSPNGNGDYSLINTGIISDPFWSATDSRRTLLVTAAGKIYLNKYPKAPSDPDYVPVVRYSEILLNLSEALVRNTNTIDSRAVELLNEVHKRSDPATTFTVASFTSTNDLLNKILLERRIELLGEGFRSLDIQRLGLTFPAKGSAPAVDPTQSAYIWPIPQNEMLYNKLCVQNP